MFVIFREKAGHCLSLSLYVFSLISASFDFCIHKSIAIFGCMMSKRQNYYKIIENKNVCISSKRAREKIIIIELEKPR